MNFKPYSVAAGSFHQSLPLVITGSGFDMVFRWKLNVKVNMKIIMHSVILCFVSYLEFVCQKHSGKTWQLQSSLSVVPLFLVRNVGRSQP